MTFDEGARWALVDTTEGDRVWILFAGRFELAGMVFHGGPVFEWCAHTLRPAMMHTGVAFTDGVCIVEQAASNTLDARAAALKL